MNFEKNLKQRFENFMRNSSENYFDVHYKFFEVSKKIRDLLLNDSYFEDKYEKLDQTNYYMKHGFNFRIIRNGEIYERKYDDVLEMWHVGESCITDINSSLADHKIYYDVCVNLCYRLK